MKKIVLTSVFLAILALSGVVTAADTDCDLNNPNPDTIGYAWNFALQTTGNLTPSASLVNHQEVFKPTAMSGLNQDFSLVSDSRLHAGATLEVNGTTMAIIDGIGYKVPDNGYSSAPAVILPGGDIVVGDFSNTYFGISGATQGSATIIPNQIIRLLPPTVKYGANPTTGYTDQTGTYWLLTNSTGPVGRTVNTICHEQDPTTHAITRSCRASHTTTQWETNYGRTITVLGRNPAVGIQCAAYVSDQVGSWQFASSYYWRSSKNWQ